MEHHYYTNEWIVIDRWRPSLKGCQNQRFLYMKERNPNVINLLLLSGYVWDAVSKTQILQWCGVFEKMCSNYLDDDPGRGHPQSYVKTKNIWSDSWAQATDKSYLTDYLDILYSLALVKFWLPGCQNCLQKITTCSPWRLARHIWNSLRVVIDGQIGPGGDNTEADGVVKQPVGILLTM